MASFVDKNTISITNGKNEITASAKNFIIATGSSSIEIPNIPVDEKTNSIFNRCSFSI